MPRKRARQSRNMWWWAAATAVAVVGCLASWKTTTPPNGWHDDAGAAADSGIDAATMGTYVGGAAVVGVVGGALFLGLPALRRAWRRRRRSGDGDDAPASPMQDRTGQYRWYEDAEAVANDIENRGEAVQREDHEGLLHVPQVTTRSAPDPFAVDANASLTSALISGKLGPSVPASSVAPQRVNPLLQQHAL